MFTVLKLGLGPEDLGIWMGKLQLGLGYGYG